MNRLNLSAPDSLRWLRRRRINAQVRAMHIATQDETPAVILCDRVRHAVDRDRRHVNQFLAR